MNDNEDINFDAYYKHKMFADESMLRDFFAAMAIHGISMNEPHGSNYLLLAEKCYQMADAMLEARKK